MCHESCFSFVARNLSSDEVKGKKVIEIGSYYVNGSVRPYVEWLKPAQYIGVDIAEGPCVDEVCDSAQIVERFGEKSFDIVISTEMLEHVKDWRLIVNNLKRICKPGGIILITTRSRGFVYHPFPYDLWRYEAEDMSEIFSDLNITALEKDTQAPGIFMKALKPADYKENNLSEYKLFSMIANSRIKNIKIEIV